MSKPAKIQEQLIEPGSGADEMGAGIAFGCLKWVFIVMVIALVVLVVVKVVGI